jgi:hypothetical protein
MSHQIDIDNLAPSFIRNFLSALHSAYPGIRAKQIDMPVSLNRSLYESDHIRFAAHIGFNRQPADLLGHRCRFIRFDIGDNHARAFGGEPSAQGAAYAVGSAGHHDDFVF